MRQLRQPRWPRPRPPRHVAEAEAATLKDRGAFLAEADGQLLLNARARLSTKVRVVAS